MPIDYRDYPPDWKTVIRPRILARDGHRCRCCGVADKAYGYRDAGGRFQPLPAHAKPPPGFRALTIRMNVVHLDHKLIDHSDGNLGLMCERCHGNYDKPITARQAAYTTKYPGAAATLLLPLLT